MCKLTCLKVNESQNLKSALFGSLTEYSIFKIVIKIRFLAPAPVCEVCSMQTDFQKTVIMMESVKKKNNI